MISVVFSTKNGASRLPRTLNSLCELEFKGDWELLIVDNGSDDNTVEIISAYREKLPITLLEQTIPGKNASLNMAISHIKGEICVFTDDDVRVEPNWLTSINEVANSNKEYDIFGGAIAGEWEEAPEQWIIDYSPLGALYAIKTNDEAGPCEPGKIWGPNMFVRSSVFEDLDNRFNEKMHKKGKKAYFSNDFKVHHWISKSSINEDWIFGRAYRLGKGVVLSKIELDEDIEVIKTIFCLIIFNVLTMFRIFIRNQKRKFWIIYKSKYYLGAFRGLLVGKLSI